MRKTVLIAAVSVALAFAEDADSLRAEIEKMTARLQEIERKNTEISDDTTISIIRFKTKKKDDCEHIGTDARTVVWGEIKKGGGWREKNSIGLSGGVGVGATALDMRPAKNFLVEKSKLKNSGVSTSFGKWEAAITYGGFGVGGFGNGVVAGGGGYHTKADFVSKVFDTTFITFVGLGYGGFALGNGWQKDKNAFSLISFIGGGTYNIDVRKKILEGDLPDPKIYEDGFIKIIDGASSNFFALDLQANYVRSLMRWFHVGGEISGLFAISRRGFDYTCGYFSFSPSVRLNFIFGWL